MESRWLECEHFLFFYWFSGRLFAGVSARNHPAFDTQNFLRRQFELP
jgi:hypothetical protein